MTSQTRRKFITEKIEKIHNSACCRTERPRDTRCDLHLSSTTLSMKPTQRGSQVVATMETEPLMTGTNRTAKSESWTKYIAIAAVACIACGGVGWVLGHTEHHTRTTDSTCVSLPYTISATESELLAFQSIRTASVDSSLASDFALSVVNRVQSRMRQVPGLFAQQQGARPEGNATQLHAFGALKPWPEIMSMLSERSSRKLLLLLRHGQAWENLAPNGDNTQCNFVVQGHGIVDNFDSSLSSLGIVQAQQAHALLQQESPYNGSDAQPASWFEALGMSGAAFFSSPQSRALQTAMHVLGGFSTEGGSSGPQLTVTELLRANIGRDVCNYRRPLMSFTDASCVLYPSACKGPFTVPCNRSTNALGLQELYGSLPNITFRFGVRPSAASDSNDTSVAFGLISARDSLWRSDFHETNNQNEARASAFLSALTAPGRVSQRVVVAVTHGEIIEALWSATGGEALHVGNAEIVPLLLDF